VEAKNRPYQYTGQWCEAMERVKATGDMFQIMRTMGLG
jgi:hypothetical protein